MEVELPDGTVIEDVPEGVTQSELARRYGLHVQSQPPASPASQITSHVRQDLSDVLHGAQSFGGHVMAALTPEKSFLNDEAKYLIEQGKDIHNPVLGAALPTIATLPLGGPVAKLGEFAAGLVPNASRLAQLAAAGAGRTAGGAALGGGLGALETAGTDKSAVDAALAGATLGGVVQGGAEVLPGTLTAIRAGRNSLIDRLKGQVPQPPAVDPQVLAEAQQRGFVPHSGQVETAAQVDARDMANRQQLGTSLQQQVETAGGPISQEAAATQLAGVIRPSLERYGQGAGRAYDEFYNTGDKRVVVDPDRNPQFVQDVRNAIAGEQQQVAPDREFLNIANRMLVGDVPNPEFQAALRGANPSMVPYAREALLREGRIPEYVRASDLPGYDAATGTIPAGVSQANITRFGERAAGSTPAHSRQGYGALMGALQRAQEASLSPAEAAQLQNMRETYRHFSELDRTSPQKDIELLNRLQRGDTQTLHGLSEILDEGDRAVVEQLTGRRLLTGLRDTAQGGRPSVQDIDPRTFERAYNAIPPEARQAYLPERSMTDLSRISGELLAPQEGLALRPEGLTGKLVEKLLGVGSGLAGAAALAPLKHPFSSYAAGKAIGTDKGAELIRRLINRPTPALNEAAPNLRRATPALIQALILSGGSQ